MTLKIRCRSRPRRPTSPTIAAPNTNPPISDESRSPSGCPRPRACLTIPVTYRCRLYQTTPMKTAQPRDQEGDHPGRNRRGRQHAETVAVGRSRPPVGTVPNSARPAANGTTTGDDRGHCAQRRHHRDACANSPAAAARPDVAQYEPGPSSPRFCQAQAHTAQHRLARIAAMHHSSPPPTAA